MARLLTVIFLVLFWFPQGGFSQVSKGGNPPSFLAKLAVDGIPEIKLGDIDYENIRIEDEINDKSGSPYRYAISIPVDVGLLDHAAEDHIRGKGTIWRLKFSAPTALALSACFNLFYIPRGGELYIYNESGEEIIGAFGNHNNHSSQM